MQDVGGSLQFGYLELHGLGVVLQQGYLVTLAVALAGFGLACYWLLDVEGAPAAS